MLCLVAAVEFISFSVSNRISSQPMSLADQLRSSISPSFAHEPAEPSLGGELTVKPKNHRRHRLYRAANVFGGYRNTRVVLLDEQLGSPRR